MIPESVVESDLFWDAGLEQNESSFLSHTLTDNNDGYVDDNSFGMEICTLCDARGFLGESKCPPCNGISINYWVDDAFDRYEDAEEDTEPALCDSDDEEDFPDMPMEELCTSQAKRRPHRLKYEAQKERWILLYKHPEDLPSVDGSVGSSLPALMSTGSGGGTIN